MSGALASVTKQGERLPLVRTRKSRLHTLEALERGFALFQFTFSTQAWRYYLGATPFLLCFIPIWVIDGQIEISNSSLLMEAALLGGAYMFRLWLVADYMQRVRESAFGVPASKHKGTAARTEIVGRLLGWKITTSLAAIATLLSVGGAPWFYSACEFSSLEAAEQSGERHSLSGCFALASQWYGGSVLFFLMLVPLWTAVWLNGLMLVLIVPQLLHSIFGVNTLLTTQRGVASLMQSSAFWLSLFAGTWLALDPIVKCTYVVVYQHLRSRREGEDLRGLMALLPREQKQKAEMAAGRVATAGSFLILFVAVTVVFPLRALQAAPLQQNQSEAAALPDSAGVARIQKLRGALDEESQRAIYRWHDAEHPSQPTWFDKLMIKLGHTIKEAWDNATSFLGKFWPKGLQLTMGTGNRGTWRLNDLRLWLALIAALTLTAGGFLIWRRRRRRREAPELSIPVATIPLPDLSDAVASERSEDEWFTLAQRLEAEGELRLAVRAAYLGLLAGLAQREWLTIRRDRTNREYLDEFTRRWRRRPQASVEARAEVPEKLRGSLRLFDRVWYGAHLLTPSAVAVYRQDQMELLGDVR